MEKLTFHFFSRNLKHTLERALALYTGRCLQYGGAEFFSSEANALMRQLEVAPSRIRLSIFCDPIGKIDLYSPEDIMGIICSLKLYLGHYPDAHRYTSPFPNKEAEYLLHYFTTNYSNHISHLI